MNDKLFFNKTERQNFFLYTDAVTGVLGEENACGSKAWFIEVKLEERSSSSRLARRYMVGAIITWRILTPWRATVTDAYNYEYGDYASKSNDLSIQNMLFVIEVFHKHRY